MVEARKRRVDRRKRCHYCQRPALPGRLWCRVCLDRIEYSGVVDGPEYPTRQDARRAKPR